MAKAAAAKAATKLNEEEQYDSVPYESYVYPKTHPDHLYTIGTLFHMDPPPFESARVLELGCASGGNILPLAMQFPDASFVGIDLSGKQIDLAKGHVKALGLKNIKFEKKDITALGKKFGEFDYIICHGILSWVPQPVREGIFAACRDLLSDKGLAVISYNALPGWNAVKSLREMMLYHAGNFNDPKQKVREAVKMLNFVKENASGRSAVMGEIIKYELDILSKTNDSYVFHDHLESENHPFYLHDFADQARAADLAYVGDVEISSMYLGNYNEKVQESLKGLSKDTVRTEQYIDFLNNTRFKHSIVTKAANAKNIKRNLEPDELAKMYVDVRFVPDAKATEKAKEEGDDSGLTIFRCGNVPFKGGNKQTETVLKAMCAFGDRFNLEDIKPLAKEIDKDIDDKAIEAIFKANIAPFALKNFITLSSSGRTHVREISKKPKAFSFAQYQAESSPQILKVTNMRRQTIGLDVFGRALLLACDGKRDEKALIEAMVENVKNGTLSLKQGDKPVTDEKEIRKLMDAPLKKGLEHLRRAALLEA